MNRDCEVYFEQLMSNKYPEYLTFRSTEELRGYDNLIGQEKAEESMKFGVGIKEKGYNIYICGDNGSGRTYYAKKFLEQISKGGNPHYDWCYVYNFENENEPIAISFEAGTGKVFKQDMNFIINEIIEKIPAAFDSDEYDKQKSEIMQDYHTEKNKLIDALNKCAESYDLQVKATSSGFAFVPFVDGKSLSEAEYDNLDTDVRDSILKKISMVRVKAVEILRMLKASEKEAEEKVKILDKEIALYVLESFLEDYVHKYSTDEKVQKYFDCVKKDILENLSTFSQGISTKDNKDILIKYKVNLILDNSQVKGVPVVYESNPTYANLFGSVEYESKQDNITTDFLKIRAGSVLKANRGYLIVKINEVLKNYKSWEGLKRIIDSEELKIDSIRSQLDLLTIKSIKPEPIPVSFKIVLIGDEYTYHLLYEYDDEFRSMFKVKVEFDDNMEKNADNIGKMSSYIGNYCSKKNIKHLDNNAVSEILQYSSRLSGSSSRLSTHMEDIIDLIEEANIWADISGNKYISRDDIKKAIYEKNKRSNLIEDKMLRNYEQGKIIIDVKDKCAGQINGLAVVESGRCSFGKPYRITASTYMGKNGIINIEREAQMSGNIHNKSVMIISGYLGEKYAKSIPLSLSAHICFEQLYGFIDGDSASIAELYAILSSLAGIPLRQDIAVTGSLNQRGEVQPVGGINQKIEGFYKVCSLYGLTKKQGVIIPYQNIDDMVLDDDVMKEIKNKNFHIYAIKNVEEGIELLTGMRAGTSKDRNEFDENTFNYFVDKKLKDFIKNYNMLEEIKHNA